VPDKPDGPQLRARLLTVSFEQLLPILTGRRRIANLPVEGYVRSVQVNMKNECVELMVIDPSFQPVVNLGDMPVSAAEVVDVAPPKPAKATKRK
jgi:hypothetical protein